MIATLFGYCLGGGLELPLACHFRLAASDASIGFPELDLGTVPAWGGTARLTCTVGRAHALDMILRRKKIDRPTALAIGLVHEIHPIGDLKRKAIELAEELAGQPPSRWLGCCAPSSVRGTCRSTTRYASNGRRFDGAAFRQISAKASRPSWRSDGPSSRADDGAQGRSHAERAIEGR